MKGGARHVARNFDDVTEQTWRTVV